MKQILNLVQNTEKWHRVRRRFITATEANRLKNPENWDSMLEGKLNPNIIKFQNKAMKKGNDLEPEARNTINESMGSVFKPLCVIDRQFGAMCSLDGSDEQALLILEIKCPEKDDVSVLYLDALQNKIPSQYRDQMQFQLMVTGAQYCTYMVYVGRGKYKSILVTRDEVAIMKFQTLCLEFWEYAESKMNERKRAA